MGYVLDIIVAVIIAISAFVAAKRGFVRTAIELAGFILAIVLAFNLGPSVSDAVYDGTIHKSVTNKIADAIVEKIDDKTEAKSEAVWDAVPGFVASNIEFFGVDKEGIDAKLETATADTASLVAADISKEYVKPVVSAAICGIVGLVLFIVLSILIKYIAIPINKLFTISIVGTLNRVLGAVLGAGKGVVYAAVFCLIISTLVVFTDSGFLIFTREAIEESSLAKILCGLNPVF